MEQVVIGEGRFFGLRQETGDGLTITIAEPVSAARPSEVTVNSKLVETTANHFLSLRRFIQ